MSPLRLVSCLFRFKTARKARRARIAAHKAYLDAARRNDTRDKHTALDKLQRATTDQLRLELGR